MSGKTQIAQELSRRTDIPYFKASSEHGAYLSSKVEKRDLFLNQLRYADPRVADLLKQTKQSVIFDRGYPCEWVYSKVMARDSDATMLFHLDDVWSDMGAKIVLCHRSSYLGIVDDLDPKINSHTLDALHDEYWHFANHVTKCQVHKLNVDDENLDREVDEVIKFMGFNK